MRYSRIRRKKRQRNYTRFFLIGLTLFAIIYIVSAGAIGKKLSSIIAPRLSLKEEKSAKDDDNEDDGKSKESNPDRADGEKADEGQSSGKEIEKISETVEVAPLTIFTIQLGAFATEENAKELAQEVRERGAGGYIIKDEF